MNIVDACKNCRWSFVCREETGVDYLCDDYELDRLNDNYVDGIIEMKRIEHLEDYEEYLRDSQY